MTPPDGIRFSIEAIARVAWANRLDPLTAAFAEEAIAGSLTSTAAIDRLALSCHGAGLVEADDFALAFGVSCLAIGHRIKLAWDPRHPFDVLVAVEEKDPRPNEAVTDGPRAVRWTYYRNDGCGFFPWADWESTLWTVEPGEDLR